MSPLPPYAERLGLVLEAQAEGPPLLHMPFAARLVGRPGFLHGGAIAGLLETAALVALRYALDREGGGGIKPVNVTLDYRRGGTDRPTCAAGLVTRLGRRIANVEALAWQDDRARPIATARLHYLLSRAERTGESPGSA